MHPSITMAKPLRPEPKYFLVDEVFEKGLDYYTKHWFGSVPDGIITGEKSANYLESSVAAHRIKSQIPDIRLIFILRDPVNRAWSNYLWSKMNGLETMDFREAILHESERELILPPHLRYARPFSYVSRGMYADFLSVYLELFSNEKILCLFYEELRESPVMLLDQVHAFLGVELRGEDGSGLGVVNPATGNDDIIPEDCRELLEARFLEPNQKLDAMLGRRNKAWS